ncbi:hypothetical protein [Xenorhabdus thuongxuanensis]|nr:hypothetical protein [Xenorhabdus thuongxuanensis]
MYSVGVDKFVTHLSGIVQLCELPKAGELTEILTVQGYFFDVDIL